MKGTSKHILVLCGAAIILSVCSAFSAQKTVFTRRYVNITFDLMQRKDWIDRAHKQMDRASRAGYNAMFVSGYYGNLHKDKNLQKGVSKFKEMLAYAKSKGLHAIPHDLRQYAPTIIDSSVAEAIQVKKTPFKVKGKEARVVSDHTVAFKNGNFSLGTNHWGITGPNVSAQGGGVCFDNPTKPAKITQRVDGLKPWRAYQISVRIRTQNFKGHRQIRAHAWGSTGRYLLVPRGSCFGRWGVSPNLGGFVQYAVDFNSMDCSWAKIDLVALARGSSTGKVWFDDVAIKEVGLYETIRRKNCPVKVTSEDGGTTYEEGKDYEVEPSNYLLDVNRRPPFGQKLIIPDGSSIKDGEKLRVDWWQHANMESPVYGPTAFCSERAWGIVTQMIENADGLFGTRQGDVPSPPQSYMVDYDEWRAAYWDSNCRAQYKDAGEYMGRTMARTYDIIKKPFSSREVFVWSDMYDPYQNAGKYANNYFMVNGNYWGAWKYVPKDVVMIVWWYHDTGFRFLAGLDTLHPGISFPHIYAATSSSACTRYNVMLTQIDKEGGVPPYGAMFETENFGDANMEQVAQYWKSVGRWGSNPYPMPSKAKYAPRISQTPQNISLANKSGVLEFSLKQETDLQVGLFDAKGRQIRILADGMQKRGTQKIDLKELGLAAGLYVVRLKIEGNSNGNSERVLKVAIL